MRLQKGSDGSRWGKSCNCSNVPRAFSLADHEKSQKHEKNIAAVDQCNNLSSFVKWSRKEDSVKVAELHLAVCVACHCSMTVIGHFDEIVRQHGKGSPLESLYLQRTKCSLLISRVIAPFTKEGVKEDLSGWKCSILLDESTDCSTTKELCILIRYYSPSLGEDCYACH